ncbi:nascent polypeptide-associated complex protein [Vulcanisaeta sp. JCM 14467]|uniref:nascent polypeptide-associated complex protein n=1 Tax=Vulcanisaeta sp. JCM 14467 TaxID=1295370 RepID=UPI0006CFDAF6|nr:nascent polypeptide-associated complex protein [Vulcanisaeta sp. JCM 14467]
MGINPREVRKLLKRLGIQDLNLEEVSNVTKVIIYLGDGSTIEINKPVVARMRIQGLSIYQVQASDSDIRVVKPQPTLPQPRPSLIIQQPQQQATSTPVIETAKRYEPSEDDIKLVMEETGCTREEAIKALRETNGDIAEAIVRIQSQKGR